jgi:hypothetical protein
MRLLNQLRDKVDFPWPNVTMARNAGYIGTRKDCGTPSICYALASGTALSEVEKERIAIRPEVLTAGI